MEMKEQKKKNENRQTAKPSWAEPRQQQFSYTHAGRERKKKSPSYDFNSVGSGTRTMSAHSPTNERI